MNDEKFDDEKMEYEREQQWEHNQRKGRMEMSARIAMALEALETLEAGLWAGPTTSVVVRHEISRIQLLLKGIL